MRNKLKYFFAEFLDTLKLLFAQPDTIIAMTLELSGIVLIVFLLINWLS